MHRSVRFASVALVVAAMSACSNDITAPAQSAPNAPALAKGGAPKVTEPGPSQPVTQMCGGYLLSTGKCQ